MRVPPKLGELGVAERRRPRSITPENLERNGEIAPTFVSNLPGALEEEMVLDVTTWWLVSSRHDGSLEEGESRGGWEMALGGQWLC